MTRCASRFVAVGAGGTVVHVEASGTIWSEQLSDTSADLFAVTFLDGSNGWAIETRAGDLDPEAQDAADAEALYGLLEFVVGPLYYHRDPSGIPVGWVRLMKRVIETVAPRFSARRLLKEYVEQLYAPALSGGAER